MGLLDRLLGRDSKPTLDESDLAKQANPRRRTRDMGKFYPYRTKPFVERPAIDPHVAFNVATNVWIIRAAIDKTVQEAATKITFKEKFAARCDKCDLELDSVPDDETCPGCGNERLKRPEKSQLKRVKAVLERPNEDRMGRVAFTTNQLLRDIFWYNQSIDDFFWEIVPGIDGNPAEIWPLPSEFIRHADDVQNGLALYCPHCWDPDTDRWYALEQYEEGETCPVCGKLNLELTEWVQIDLQESPKIVARFSERRILHWNAFGLGGRRWGLPKVLAVYRMAQVLIWQELKQFQFYSQDFDPDRGIFFPGMGPEEVEDIQEEILERKVRNPGKLVTIFGHAAEPPVAVELGRDFEKYQAIDWAKHMREAVAVVYGVSLQMLGVQTPGKLGDETESVEVSFSTIEKAQGVINDFLNERFLKSFHTRTIDGKKVPLVTDWVIELESARREDKARKGGVQRVNLSVAQQLEEMGYPVDLDENEDFTPTIAGPRKPEEERQPQQPENPFGDGGGGGGFGGGNFPGGLGSLFDMGKEKARSPRRTPPANSVPGIVTLEDEFYDDLKRELGEAMSRAEQTPGGIEGALDDFLRFAEDRARRHVRTVYEEGMERELPGASFAQVDENAIDFILSMDDGIMPALENTTAEMQRDIERVIQETFTSGEPMDLPALTERLQEVSDAGKSRLERIARTETSRIVNLARANQWKKYADPEEDQFEWIVARHRTGGDARVCPVCKAIAFGGRPRDYAGPGDSIPRKYRGTKFKGNPYTLDELESAVEHLVAHPNERCTVVRKPAGVSKELTPEQIAFAKEWEPYEGPKGGTGWRNKRTKKVVYSSTSHEVGDE